MSPLRSSKFIPHLTLSALPLTSAAHFSRRDVRHPVEYLFRFRLVIRHRAGEFAPRRPVHLVAVVSEIFEALPILIGQHLLRKRFEVFDLISGDAEFLADAFPVLVVDHEEMPQHTLLHVAFTLREQRAHVVHEVIAFPLLHLAEPHTRLEVVVPPVDDLADQTPADLRRVVRQLLRFVQAVVERGFEIHVRVLPGGEVHTV